MSLSKSAAAIGFAVLLLGGTASADAGADLAGLLRGYLDAERRLHPTEAIERGDPKYLDRYDENLTAAYMADRRRLNEGTRTRLSSIARTALKPDDQLTYDIFRWELDDEAGELKPGIAERFQLLPLNQFDGAHIAFAREMQWRADYPFNRAQDYDSAIRRMLGFTHWLDAAIVKMREGIKEGVVQPRTIVERMIAQTEPLASGEPDASLFMGPVKNMPAQIRGPERARIENAYREAVAGQLLPAYRRLLDFFKTEYLPHARDSIGLSAIPGGKDMYLHLVRSETTEEASPDAIHAQGLLELARIEGDMEAVKKEAGFTGSLDRFREFLRGDPRFKYKDPDAMMAEFVRVKNAVTERLGEVFLTRPKAPLTFRFYESFLAPDKPEAEYAAASANGSRPGIVYLNAYDLFSRPTYTSEVLELHEGIPGHHLQAALAAENRALSRFRRFETPSAFVEGWALYAETLGPVLGLFTDPYQKFGALSFDAWRASRLVVDTGIHWQGWSRGQAVDFLLAHTALSPSEAGEEVDRYTAIPAQALAYKIGEREFLDLRDRAMTALGAKFDLRRFHDALLKDGAMPLPILDAKIERWIAQEKGA